MSFTYTFKAKVIEQKDAAGKYTFAFVKVPGKTQRELPLDLYPRLRVCGEVNGHPFEAALQPSGGRWNLMLSRRRLKEFQLAVGDNVSVGFEIADQDAVAVPDELQQALDEDSTATEIWESLTSGKRRGFAYRVSSAKQQTTRERRVIEVLQSLDELEGQ